MSSLIVFLVSIILFGPHRLPLFSVDLQYLSIIALALLSLYRIPLTKLQLYSIISLSFLFVALSIVSILSGFLSPIILLSPLRIILSLLGFRLLYALSSLRLLHLLRVATVFSIANSLVIIAQFYFPDLRLIFSYGELSSQGGIVEYVTRFSGLASDGYQLTTLVACFLGILYFRLVSFSVRTVRLDQVFVLLLFVLSPISWLLQGRLAALISIPLFVGTIAWSLVAAPRRSTILGALVSGCYIAIFSAVVFLSSPSSSLPSDYLFSTISDLHSDPSLHYLSITDTIFDYNRNFLSSLVGSGEDGRIVSGVIARFDNGYYLFLFRFGFIGSLWLLFPILFFLATVHCSTYSVIFALVVSLVHVKEQILFSGCFFYAFSLFSCFPFRPNLAVGRFRI